MATKNKAQENLATEEEVKKSKYEVVEESFGDELDNMSDGDISTSDYSDCLFINIVTKDAAYFKFSKKKNDKLIVDPRTNIQTISGNVKKIELDNYTYDGKIVQTFKIHLERIKDDGTKILYILNSSLSTNTGRNILNCLLGWDKNIEKILISVYIKDGFTSSKVLINGERSKWKFSPEEQKKYIEVITNKKGERVSVDYSDYIDILVDQTRSKLSIWLPNQQHINFVEEDANDVLSDEATFGEDEPGDFFEINETE